MAKLSQRDRPLFNSIKARLVAFHPLYLPFISRFAVRRSFSRNHRKCSRRPATLS
jgi:hypothetical protein